MSFLERVEKVPKEVWQFIDTKIWEKSKSSIKDRIIMTIYIAVRRYSIDDLQNKSSALTFNTLLAIIPILALIFAVMKGLGFANIIEPSYFERSLFDKKTVMKIFSFIDNYLSQTKDGLFIGVGLVSLLITVWSLISTLERIFNDIWRTKNLRSYKRIFTDYFSLIFILPFLLIFASGFTAFLSTALNEHFPLDFILSPTIILITKIIPWITSWLLFSIAYIFIPNTKVKISSALISGLLAGAAFYVFQMIYISGQIWLTRYNAIFGSFAMIPLLMLWLQVSWLICLIGAEIACAGQNIESLKEEVRYLKGNITPVDREFLSLVITHTIVRRMQLSLPPITAQRLAFETFTPIRLVRETLNKLLQAKVIVCCKNGDAEENYVPYLDINILSIGMLYEKIGKSGNTNLFDKTNEKYRTLYDYYMKLKNEEWKIEQSILIKDL
ncbi:MAG TPA: YihY/virulence factor BrkB family protein [Porphyromonadaceae bacterium]|nr:YihY/virulence factor BrkB family protein [Porphyromonadaceae bacterium]